jgi:uncharacterized repeat protein (TIGR01451 family)
VRTTITSDAPADLQITKRDLIDPVRAGETLTYTITVSNTGPASATGVIVNDTLPISVTLRSVTASQGSCVLTNCQLGALAVNGRATVTLAVNVDPAATGVITNTATVAANEEDPAMGNNSAHARTTVLREANLSIAKTGTPQPVFAGRNLAYRLEINNHGPSRAEGVHVVDPLPTAVSFVSAPAGCIHTNGTVDCYLGRLSPSSSRTITITTQVALAASGLVQNTASVSSSTTDPVQANNQSNWSSSILAPDLVLPTVTWTQPVSNGAMYPVNCQIVHLQVNATDNIAIQSVRFYRWDAKINSFVDIGYDTTAPYGWDIDTCNLNPNWNQIFAEAHDTYGNRDWTVPEERKFIWLYRHILLYLPEVSK